MSLSENENPAFYVLDSRSLLMTKCFKTFFNFPLMVSYILDSFVRVSRDVPMGGVGGGVTPSNAHETAKKLVIKQIL